MIIQIILILFSAIILIYFLSNPHSMQMRAYKKVGLLLVVVAMVVFVLFPEFLNDIAQKVGVGRGADLLLYGLFVAFVMFAVNVYLKFKAQQEVIHRLARKIALLGAEDQKK